MSDPLPSSLAFHSHCFLLSWFFPCTAVSCGHPGNFAHGRTNGNTFTFNQTVLLSCPEGFSLQGASILSCLANRSWSNALPFCLPRHCPTPNNTNQHRSSSTNHTVSSTTTFQCDTGYESNNSLSVYCHYNQSWSSIFPTCTPVKCPKPVQNPNVLLTIPSPAEFSDEDLVASCAVGYEIESGNSRRQCLSSGSWSGDDFVCKRKTCPALTSPVNGILSNTEGFRFESTVYFRCNTGYNLTGSMQHNLTCTSLASWSGTAPTCTGKLMKTASPSDSDLFTSMTLVLLCMKLDT